MADAWKTFSVQCKGGLNTSQDTLSYSPGEAASLVNFEPSKFGGYRRINGFTKYDTAEVPGTGNVLGVCVYNGTNPGVIAAREDDVYFSTGSGWGSAINGATPRTSAGKYRFASYDYATTKKVAMCDGVNYAATWDGTTYTLLNSADAPTDPKYVTFFLRRIVLAGYSANKQAIILSAPDTDDDFAAANGAIELSVRDEIVGIRAFRNELYIFGKKTINKLTGTSSTDFAVVPVAANLGCVAADSIQEFNGQLFFLAPDGMRSVQATQRIDDVEIGTISKSVFSVAQGMLDTAADSDNISSCVVRKKSQYRIWYPTTTQSESDAQGLLAGIRYGTQTQNLSSPEASLEWAQLQGMKPACADSGYAGTEELVIHGGFADSSGDAYVYKQETGFDFDEANIPSVYRTAPFVMDDVELRKLIQKVSLYMQVEGTVSIGANIIFDLNALTTMQPSAALGFSAGTTLLVYGGSSSTYGSATYGGANQPRLTANAIGSGFIVQLDFTNTGVQPCFSIQGLSLQYRLLGRR